MKEKSLRELFLEELILQVSEEDANRILDEFDEFRLKNSDKWNKDYIEKGIEGVLEIFSFIPQKVKEVLEKK